MSQVLVRLIPLILFPVIVAAAIACQVGLVDAPDEPPLAAAPEATSTPLDDEAVATSPAVAPSGTPSRPSPTRTPAPTGTPDRTSCEEIRGTQYHSAQERDWYLANCVTPVPTSVVPQPNPPPIPGPDVAGERWVLVDIASQTASAMIGDQFLYTALATTGIDGWNTPVGTWHIVYRVENETMTSASIGAEEFYVLEDVLYTQYFTTVGHALHLNYWRSDDYFGSTRSSHGCVGLRLADAKFFWDFAKTGTRVTVQ